jgi:hypothetical protein
MAMKTKLNGWTQCVVKTFKVLKFSVLREGIPPTRCIPIPGNRNFFFALADGHPVIAQYIIPTKVIKDVSNQKYSTNCQSAAAIVPENALRPFSHEKCDAGTVPRGCHDHCTLPHSLGCIGRRPD